MRSSVVEPLPASQPAEMQGQRHQYQPLYSPRKPYPPPPTSKHLKSTSERSLVLAPAEGWLVLLLLAGSCLHANDAKTAEDDAQTKLDALKTRLPGIVAGEPV